MTAKKSIPLSREYAPMYRRRGTVMTDAIVGRVVVSGTHDAPIPWPYRKRSGTHALIVCGGLLEALHTEMAGAIAWYWNITPTTVWAWRKALGINGRKTPATLKNKRETFRRHISLEAQARGLANTKTPDAIARMAASKKGFRMPEEAKARISAYQRGRPKSPEHRAKLAAHLARINAARKAARNKRLNVPRGTTNPLNMRKQSDLRKLR